MAEPTYDELKARLAELESKNSCGVPGNVKASLMSSFMRKCEQSEETPSKLKNFLEKITKDNEKRIEELEAEKRNLDLERLTAIDTRYIDIRLMEIREELQDLTDA